MTAKMNESALLMTIGGEVQGHGGTPNPRCCLGVRRRGAPNYLPCIVIDTSRLPEGV